MENKGLAIALVTVLLLSTVIASVLVILLEQELNDPFKPVNISETNPIYGDILTDRPTKTLDVQFNPKTKN